MLVESKVRILTYLIKGGLVLSFISLLIYTTAGLWLDALFGLVATVFMTILFYLFSYQKIKYNTASILLSVFAIFLVTVGFIISNTIEEGLIYMIVPTVIISLTRSTKEAVIWLLFYYGAFLLINLAEIPNYPISFLVFLQLFTIHSIVLFFIVFHRNEEEALRTKLKNLNAVLEKIAITDSHTGAFNKSTYNDICEMLLSKQIEENSPFSLAVIDIDHFKQINDQHGHLVGDEVLQELSSIILESIGENDSLIRYGGDEFVVCFDGIDLFEARQQIEKVYKRIKEITLFTHYTVTISTGLAQVNQKDSPKSIFDRADKALYEAKKKGRGCIASADAQ